MSTFDLAPFGLSIVAPTWVVGILIGIDFAIRIIAIGSIPGNRRPSSAMAWLLLIFFVPYFGLFAFLLLGNNNLERRRERRQKEANDQVIEGVKDIPALRSGASEPEYIGSVARLNRNLATLPCQDGNLVRFLPHYDETFAEMATEIDRATSFVHVEFYIAIWDDATDPVFAALIRAAERGVTVRFLHDHIANLMAKGNRRTQKRLRKTAIQMHPMLPIQPLRGKWRRPDLRNHRKILIIDGRVAFSGSQNLIDARYGKGNNREWVDLFMRLEGDIVSALGVVFAVDWFTETNEILHDELVPVDREPDPGTITGQVVPSGPGFADENNLRLFTTLMYSAMERLVITSPYFVPDESLLAAVTTAAQRGVEVELHVCEKGDQFMVHHAQQSYYRALLESGVRIFLYPQPYVLHAKHFTVDDEIAVVGSSNLDMRSFALNYEVSVMLIGPEAVAGVAEVQRGYREMSRELDLAEWLERPLAKRYIDNVMRLTSALQ